MATFINNHKVLFLKLASQLNVMNDHFHINTSMKTYKKGNSLAYNQSLLEVVCICNARANLRR